jgi:orotate phosphoribosyltransferase
MSHFRKEAAKILLDTKSVLFNTKEPFVLTSGKVSPTYVDCRRLISFPHERSQLMDAGVKLLNDTIGADQIDFLAGGETAGIPYAAFMADRMNKPMLYVRKKPKGFGRMAQIEGCMDHEGMKAILIEDLQTDGGSKKVFIDALREAGAVVKHSFVIFHYGIFPQSLENMKALGIQLHFLTEWWDILAVAREHNYFDRDTLSEVEAFLNNPTKWQEDNSHKAIRVTG